MDLTSPPLINRVANSALITINLEDWFPKEEIVTIDLKEYLFQELILKEKDFRKALKELDWSTYTNKIINVICTADAIIPMWAYMLIASHAEGYAKTVFVGSTEEFLSNHYTQAIDNIDLNQYQDQLTVIKGCSNKPVPASAYAYLTFKLQSVAKKIMFGEPCSTVPIYKRG